VLARRWDLLLNDGTSTFPLSGLSSYYYGASVIFFNSGDDLIATPTLLQFDFNGDSSFMAFFLYFLGEPGPPECGSDWSFETTGGGTACNGATGDEEGVQAPCPPTYSAESGLVTIGTAETTVAEPSTYGLTPLALGLLGSMRRRVAQASGRRPSALGL